jgi:hypothetical protein
MINALYDGLSYRFLLLLLLFRLEVALPHGEAGCSGRSVFRAIGPAYALKTNDRDFHIFFE